MSKSFARFLPLLLIVLSLTNAHAQTSAARRSTDRVANASSPITITVDATEAPRKIFHARLVFPVQPGPLTLFYPQWIPGEHGPTGPINNLAGLKFSAGGKQIPWQRDLTDMFAFHCDVPTGANQLEVALDFLSPASTEGFSSGASATAQLAVINWNQLLLYPQGRPAADFSYQLNLRLPVGWKFGTALPLRDNSNAADAPAATNAIISFKPVSLVTLIDSPLVAGANFRKVQLTPPGASEPSHEIDMASDSQTALAMTPQMVANYQQLVAESGTLFGARHYTKYHFLYTLSDRVASFGLEHHESSDDRVGERTLLDDSLRKLAADLLPHEFVHSWNGKYRRPADLTTPDYEQPMRTDLLWVYEGLTQHLGKVLTARSGLWTPEEYREDIASLAAALDHRSGRTWRPLADTAVAAQFLYNATSDWANFRRGTDFYDEGVLVWLEADAIIRQQSNGARSLDDFCKRFHGGASTPPLVKTYNFDEVAQTLNAVAPYDWRAFLTERLTSTSPRAPLGGIGRGGWRLVYTDTPNDIDKAREQTAHALNLNYSLGFVMRDDGAIADVVPGMPGAQAGLAPGMKILAIGGRRFSSDAMRETLRQAKTDAHPIELLVENGEFYKTYTINYHEGERYPHLERNAAQPDLLGDIIKAHAAQSASTAKTHAFKSNSMSMTSIKRGHEYGRQN